jgi:hypothetical protein
MLPLTCQRSIHPSNHQTLLRERYVRDFNDCHLVVTHLNAVTIRSTRTLSSTWCVCWGRCAGLCLWWVPNEWHECVQRVAVCTVYLWNYVARKRFVTWIFVSCQSNQTLLYRVIWNDCRGFNDLSYSVHLR